jgi:hypothetical protein
MDCINGILAFHENYVLAYWLYHVFTDLLNTMQAGLTWASTHYKLNPWKDKPNHQAPASTLN